MVMHNRNEGSDAPHWWDDLPPKVRDRFRQPIAHDAEPESEPSEPVEPTAHLDEPVPLPTRAELVGDLSRFAMFVLVAAVAILFYMLVAVTFVNG